MDTPDILTQQPPQEHAQPSQEYHFDEIAGIEQAMISLVAQLKDAIDTAQYDTLISDDAGGRIPTLVLRRIIQNRTPSHVINTFFISAGRSLSGYDSEAVNHYLTHMTSQTKKALIVSQLLYSGKTLHGLVDTLHGVDILDVDVAVVRQATPSAQFEDALLDMLGHNKLYIGETGHSDANLDDEHEHMSGISKSHEPDNPVPMKLASYIKEYGREFSSAQENEIFGIKESDSQKTKYRKKDNTNAIREYQERKFAPLTEAEQADIQRSINHAREDVALLATRVIQSVWSGTQA